MFTGGTVSILTHGHISDISTKVLAKVQMGFDISPSEPLANGLTALV